MKKTQIYFLDTTLRDGEQTPGVSFHLSEKLKIAKALETLGVDVIEAGFANASKGDFKAIQKISSEITNSTICSLARCLPSDILAAKKALEKAPKKRIHLFIATSPLHMKYKLKMTAEEVLQQAYQSMKLAKKYFADIEFSFEDATRSDVGFLCEMSNMLIAEGVSVLNVPDTVGYATVFEYGKLLNTLQLKVPRMNEIILSVHTHNDLGLGVATSLEGIRQGARQVECTINGLGERAGNAALEEIAMNIKTRKDFYNSFTNIDSKQLYKISRLVSSLSGIDLPPNKPVMGANAFTHQSGIHQHGILKNRKTYEIMNPSDLGIPEDNITLGKLSGRHAFKERAKELGFVLDEDYIESAFIRFKDLADKKKNISDKDIIALLQQQQLTTEEAGYSLNTFQIFSGNKMTSTATVSLKSKETITTRAACGDGPVEACFQAIDLITNIPCALIHYNLKAITQGQDALGEVTVRIKRKETTIMGRGVSSDIIEASCLAYLNAVNRMVALEASDDT